MMELWLRLEAFFEILVTRNVLIEVAILLGALLAGGMAALLLRARYRRRLLNVPMALSWEYFWTQSNVAVLPMVVVLVLVLLARGALQGGSTLDLTLLGAAARLITVYIVVRIGALLFAASLGAKSWMQSWETRASLLIWLAIAAQYLGWLDPIIDTLDMIGLTAGKTPRDRLVGAQAAVHPDHLHAGRRLAQPLGRAARQAPQEHCAVDAHRHRQVRQRVPHRPEHPHGTECGGRGSDRAHRAYRCHRPGARLRPAVDRRQLRQRLRAADGPFHQAGRRHQPVGPERHEHGELRLGAGAARPLRGGARPRWGRDAGAEPAAYLQCRDQLELHRPAHPPQAARAHQLP